MAEGGGRLDRERPHWRLSPRTAALSAAVLVGLFAGLACAVASGRVADLDALVAGWLAGLRHPLVTVLMQAVTWLGSAAFLVPLGLLTAAWVWSAFPASAALPRRQARHGAWAVLIALSGAWLLNSALKSVFQRARPDLPPLSEAFGYSFPSGHAMVTLAFFAVSSYVVAVTFSTARGGRHTHPAVLAAAAAVVTLLVGLSRIYLGVHFPSDVAAGFAAGAAWALTVIAGFEWLRHGR
ncbi:MAG TPA: phosphatidylglycerophosphatase [Clostridiales bacterium]|nr:phosphatidylglycerophosphatase [Clostridiales bacterium]